MNSAHKMQEFLIAVAGHEGSGKTSLLKKITHQGLDHQYDPTLMESWRRLVTVDDRTDIIDLTECPSQREYSPLSKVYFETYNAVIILYSITSWESLWDASRLHEEVVQAREGADRGRGRRIPPVFLVANKLDLEEQYRVVSKDAIRVWGRDMGVEYMEISSKTGEGVEKLVGNVVRKIRVWQEEGLEMLGKQPSTVNVKAGKDGKSRRSSFVEGIKGLLSSKKDNI